MLDQCSNYLIQYLIVGIIIMIKYFKTNMFLDYLLPSIY